MSKIGASQLVQAHTILRTRAKKHPNDAVLVLGGVRDRVRKVAEGLGDTPTSLHGTLTIPEQIWLS